MASIAVDHFSSRGVRLLSSRSPVSVCATWVAPSDTDSAIGAVMKRRAPCVIASDSGTTEPARSIVPITTPPSDALPKDSPLARRWENSCAPVVTPIKVAPRLAPRVAIAPIIAGSESTNSPPQ